MRRAPPLGTSPTAPPPPAPSAARSSPSSTRNPLARSAAVLPAILTLLRSIARNEARPPAPHTKRMPNPWQTHKALQNSLTTLR